MDFPCTAGTREVPSTDCGRDPLLSGSSNMERA